MKKGVAALFTGMLVIVIGLILVTTVIDTATTATTTTGIGSFTGAASLLRLGPLVFTAAVVGSGVALVGMAIAGFAGKGPLA